MFKSIAYTDILDVVLITALIYFLLIWFKKSRAAFVLSGMLIVAGIYLLAQQFNLVLTASVFQLFFAVILFAWVVIFQEEIRRFFEQVAVWSLQRRFRPYRHKPLPKESLATLVRTAFELAAEKIGALIVLPGKNLILSHIDSGIDLNGKVSEALLKSIFDPNSLGHDGAMVIEEGIVTQFGGHLPLSKNLKKLPHGGTRHAAALGLAEVSDALCIVVSEEKGMVSVARNGDLFQVNTAENLLAMIERFYQETKPHREKMTWVDLLAKNWREKLVAFGLAILLWFVHVYGSQMVYKTFVVPVNYPKPQDTSYQVKVDPAKVEVTFSGPRRTLYFTRNDEIRLFLKGLEEMRGNHQVRLSGANLSFPKALALENIDPSRLDLLIEKKE
ncbi:MAG: diadenylate cyclase [Pseudomonadota bacterium]